MLPHFQCIKGEMLFKFGFSVNGTRQEENCCLLHMYHSVESLVADEMCDGRHRFFLLLAPLPMSKLPFSVSGNKSRDTSNSRRKKKNVKYINWSKEKNCEILWSVSGKKNINIHWWVVEKSSKSRSIGSRKKSRNSSIGRGKI